MEHPAFAKHLQGLVAGGRFELPTFGLCDLTQLSLRVGLYLHPAERDARHPVLPFPRPVDSVRLSWCFEILSSFPNLSQQSTKSNSTWAICGLVNASAFLVTYLVRLPRTGLWTAPYAHVAGWQRLLKCKSLGTNLWKQGLRYCHGKTTPHRH
jgi:hypothetical protein